MAKWVRTLFRPEGAPGTWHALAAEKEYAVANGLCGERFPSAVESAPSEERVERDGRCPSCVSALAVKQESAFARH